jgi:hypothetical protein
MAGKITKEQGIRIGINQIITYATLVPILWFIGQPILVRAMAQDIKTSVQKEVAPLNAAFSRILQRDVNRVRKEIAALKYRQRQIDDWTAEDAQDLADLQIELESLRSAMAALNVKT